MKTIREYKGKRWILISAAGLAAMQLAGCAGTTATTESQTAAASSESAEETEQKATITCQGTEATVEGSGAQTADGVLQITEAGVYTLRGDYQGQIAVDVGADETVNLILDGFQITCDTPAAIYGQSGKLILTLLEDTENSVTDGADAETEEEQAAIFTKNDLTIEGKGSLEVTGNHSHGVYSQGDLQIDAGLVQVTAAENGFKSDQQLRVISGELSVEDSQEGMEAREINIDGGLLRIYAQEDGINATRGDAEGGDDPYIRITDGTVYVNASGDGLDSNGNLYVDGGEVYVSGPEGSADGALDYDGEGLITGGTVIAAGSAGMFQGFSEESTQNMIVVYFEEQQPGGTSLALTDQSGQELFSWAPEKAFECVLISVPELEEGESYTLTSGEEKQEITISGVLTQTGERTAGGFPGGGRGGRGDGQLPEGFTQGREGGGRPEPGEGGHPNMNQGDAGERPELPEGAQPGERPEGGQGGGPRGGGRQMEGTQAAE